MEGNSRKAGIVILGIGALGLLIALGSGCGPRSPFEGRDHAWSSWKRPHGFHGKDFSEHVLKHVDERVQTLNLTEPQKEQYAAIRLRLKSELINGQENRKRLMVNVKKEMRKDLPDIHEVAGMVSDHVGMLPGAMDKGMKLFLEFYEILDENQKANVIQHLRKHLERVPFRDVTEKSGISGIDDPVSSSGSLSDQMAQKRGDRYGELL
ncbi:MAG: hypothetical protein CVU64_12540 [Deltaproteobacteria bacterium HGW-Deltaproteobacteria-21]|nr:MAG: hypothetical protein CVU64_12540 [Deltaproteobacteria bacterium HGW-Deltaproteobacteria-21]